MKVVNKSQQVVTRSLNPKAEYTRLLGLNIKAPLVGGPVFKYSMPLGQNIWLNHIWVQHLPRASSITDGVAVIFLAGAGEPLNVADLDSWEPIIRIPIIEGVIPGTIMYDGINQLSWSVKKLFTGQSRRFAIRAERFGAGDDVVQVQFEVSEG